MTSQIIIMNQRGFAMASDSAVTSGAFTSNAVQKMFMLPGRQPIAFMVMGSGTHAASGLSWDRIFHEYHLHFIKKYGKNAELDHMELYREDFTEFVGSLITKDFNDLSLRRDLYFFFTNDRNYIWRGVFDTNPEYAVESNDGEGNPILASKEETLARNIYKTLDFFSENVSKDVEKTYKLTLVRKHHSDALEKVARDILETKFSQSIIDDPTVSVMAEFLTYHIVYHDDEDFWKSSESRVVLAGFGSKDQFPSYFTLKFSSVALGMNNELLSSRNIVTPFNDVEPYTEDDVNFHSRVFIEPFAIKEFTMRITTGMDDSMFKNKRVSRVAQDVVEEWLKSKGSTEFSKVPGVGASTAEKIVEHLISEVNLPWEIGNAHWGWMSSSLLEKKGEFRSAVDRLTPIDLARMAQHLIETEAIMSSFIHSKRRVDLPVDVCYVTKENGLVWTSLKNLPDLDLNPKIKSIRRDGEMFY